MPLNQTTQKTDVGRPDIKLELLWDYIHTSTGNESVLSLLDGFMGDEIPRNSLLITEGDIYVMLKRWHDTEDPMDKAILERTLQPLVNGKITQAGWYELLSNTGSDDPSDSDDSSVRDDPQEMTNNTETPVNESGTTDPDNAYTE